MLLVNKIEHGTWVKDKSVIDIFHMARIWAISIPWPPLNTCSENITQFGVSAADVFMSAFWFLN